MLFSSTVIGHHNLKIATLPIRGTASPYPRVSLPYAEEVCISTGLLLHVAP